MQEVISDSKEAVLKAPKKKHVAGIPLEQYRFENSQSMLPIHAELFEKHRLIYMKGIMKSIVYAELRYHCKIIEELTSVLEYFPDSQNNNDLLYDA